MLFVIVDEIGRRSMAIKPEEWFKQADYDMRTAEIMFENKRYIYAIFMCHLSIEKALKGLFQNRLKMVPPKVHNLIYFIEKIQLQPPDNLYKCIFSLNRVSIPTRYPEDLQKLLKDYKKRNTAELIKGGRKVLKWLRTQL